MVTPGDEDDHDYLSCSYAGYGLEGRAFSSGGAWCVHDFGRAAPRGSAVASGVRSFMPRWECDVTLVELIKSALTRCSRSRSGVLLYRAKLHQSGGATVDCVVKCVHIGQRDRAQEQAPQELALQAARPDLFLAPVVHAAELMAVAGRYHFVVMALSAPRESLGQRLARVGGALPPADATHVIKHVLCALAALHAVNRPHGHLQPESVFYIDESAVRVADVALGVPEATAAYKPPEGPHKTTAGDLWAVGVLTLDVTLGGAWSGDGAKRVAGLPAREVSALVGSVPQTYGWLQRAAAQLLSPEAPQRGTAHAALALAPRP